MKNYIVVEVKLNEEPPAKKSKTSSVFSLNSMIFSNGTHPNKETQVLVLGISIYLKIGNLSQQN